jgi:hypothetical protein
VLLNTVTTPVAEFTWNVPVGSVIDHDGVPVNEMFCIDRVPTVVPFAEFSAIPVGDS